MGVHGLPPTRPSPRLVPRTRTPAPEPVWLPRAATFNGMVGRLEEAFQRLEGAYQELGQAYEQQRTTTSR